ncbi:hypothetical protein [uncultured Sphingorhabdus sp.]|uniref:hypothetical protein n=1 Tax=uncultured Sphingorhabdus sp. TaxID=1686106 RepID=UPI002625E9C4|nr:hypothetical protein [uncultured Sphingorhabdus sp.]HMS20213.1 hypothetical protein [Sphingorhabdus sp.]
MPGFKGRALIYPGLLIAGWIVGRSISLSASPPASIAEPALPAETRTAGAGLASVGIACPMPVPHYPTAAPQYLPMRPRFLYAGMHRQARPAFSAGRADPALALAHRPAPYTSVTETESFQFTALPATTRAQAKAQPNAALPKQRRLEFYSYNFWRQGSAGAALAPQAQYGGSQYGAIATWDPLGSAGKGPALLVRASGTPDGQQQEVAVGARWQPVRKWPVSLSVERRFRFYGKDGFAAYVAGGVDTAPLVGKLTLDAYGQAGYSLGGISSPFVDAQARVQHPLAKPLGIPIRIGGGVWVGGQKGAYRGDIGPTLSAQVDNRFADFTLQLDWRKRVVGNAAPVDGLALTVATDF